MSAYQGLSPRTPVLVGAAQVSERPTDSGYAGLSPVQLATAAARAAVLDAVGSAAALQGVDALYVTRTMADSLSPALRTQAMPFGAPVNMPRAVARQLGVQPREAIYSPACGDEPQRLAGEACERLQRGEIDMALLCGAEAISTLRLALAEGRQLDWNDPTDGPVDDRRANVGTLRTAHMAAHKLQRPPTVYPLFEHALRQRLGRSLGQHTQAMAELWAPFSAVAAANPHAASRKHLTAADIAQPVPANRMVADPHRLRMVARDQVNQGAALLFTTVAQAQALGIAPQRWVFLHGYSAVDERMVLQRQHLGESPALRQAYALALQAAGVAPHELHWLDLYSCFPVAVSLACEALGIQPSDARALTLTGGLPFFGGPGNNYSMHALVELAQRLRQHPGSRGLVGANGGLLSSHAVGIYSTQPRPFEVCSSAAAQARINALAAPAFTETPHGAARVESYTVLHGKSGPQDIIVVGRVLQTDARFIALGPQTPDARCFEAFSQGEPFDLALQVQPGEDGLNRFSLSPR